MIIFSPPDRSKHGVYLVVHFTAEASDTSQPGFKNKVTQQVIKIARTQYGIDQPDTDLTCLNAAEHGGAEEYLVIVTNDR